MTPDETTWFSATTIAGLAVITVITRGFFMIPEREVPIPDWLRQSLKLAPLAALTAVIVPEIVMSQGRLIDSWADARWPAAAAASLWYAVRPGVFGPLVVGLAVYLPLHLLRGW
jgi:branched-subunit amino acid transport protein